jgi:uncharacterized protein
MQTRKLGRTGLDVSAISLGTEYLINIPQATAIGVIHEAITRGINYFDMWWAQPEFRDAMGAAFKGHRDQAILTTHLGSIHRNGQYEKTRDTQIGARFVLDALQRLGTDHTDVLFLHNCDTQKDYDIIMGSGGPLELAQRFQREGKARFIGFSGHNATIALQAVQSGVIDILMFPVNLASHAAPGGQEVLQACAAHNVALVAMKPFAGGRLLRETQTLYVEDFQVGRTEMPGAPTRFEKPMAITPVQCLSYVLDQAGVSTTVPGCANLDELAGALAYWNATPQEKDYSAILPAFAQFANGECVYCNHCLPCSSQIDIGQTMRLLDQATQQTTAGQRPPAELQAAYDALPANASDCIQCGDCEERCPFDVAVTDKMEEAAALFGR